MSITPLFKMLAYMEDKDINYAQEALDWIERREPIQNVGDLPVGLDTHVSDCICRISDAWEYDGICIEAASGGTTLFTEWVREEEYRMWVIEALGERLLSVAQEQRCQSAQDWVRSYQANPDVFVLTLQVPEVLQEAAKRFFAEESARHFRVAKELTKLSMGKITTRDLRCPESLEAMGEVTEYLEELKTHYEEKAKEWEEKYGKKKGNQTGETGTR